MENSGKFGLLLLLLTFSVSVADDLTDCDILIARLNGDLPDSLPVSETVFDWLTMIAEDSCGLSVDFYDCTITDEDFIAFNEVVLDRNATAMLTGTCRTEGDLVLLDLVLDQIYTNPYLLVDRVHFSRPEESISLDIGLFGSSSAPPETIRFYGFLLAAFAHGRLNQNQTALTEIDRAFEYTVGVPSEALAEAYLFRSQVLTIVDQDISAGIPDLEEALEINPACIRARIALGYRYELAGDMQSALEEYSIAINTDPTMYKPYKVRGNLYSNLGMFQESIADYTMATHLNPEDFESWHYGGVDIRRTCEFERSFEWLSRALVLEPEAAQVWYDRALVNAISEVDLEKATEDLDRALELNGTEWKWYDTAATVWIMRDEWEECIEMASRGLGVSPGEPQLLIDRSVGYLMLEDIESALTDLTAAIEFADDRDDITLREDTYTIHEILQMLSNMVPDTPYYCLYLGYACSEWGYCEEAIEPYTKAIMLNQSLVDAYHLRGLCWMEMGEKEQAIEDLQKVIDMTDDPAVVEALSETLVQLQE